MSEELQIFCVVFVIFLWFMSAWEALFQLSGGRVRRVESKNRQLAEKLDEWIEHRKEYDIVFKILILFFIALMATFAFALFSVGTGSISPVLMAFFVAFKIFVLIIVAETITRFLLFRFDILILRITLPLIKIMRYSVFYPVIFLMEKVDEKIERWQTNPDNNDVATAEDEIMSLIDSISHEDEVKAIEEDEKRMIRGIFNLDDVPVKEIMTPRIDIVALPDTASIEETKEKFVQSGYSRIPVYSESIDEIKGIIYAKDFIDVRNKKLNELSHKPIFIPGSKAVGDLLNEFKKTGKHFAVIIDEFGGTSGIVTLEDIIENIVGEIKDEYDTEEDVDPEPVFLPDGSLSMGARTPIEKVNELLNSEIPEGDDIATIGGHICSVTGRIPNVGEEIKIEKNITALIQKADKRKIISVILKRSENIED